MGMSHFPNGFQHGFSVRGLPLTMAYPGKVFWVNGSSVLPDNGVAGADAPYPAHGTYLRPFATIDYAIGQCTASRGDIIMVMPGHTETVTAAGGVAIDVAGIAIVGLGRGSIRPTINLTTSSAASVTLSAADCLIHNILFTGGVNSLNNPLNISAADCIISSCEFRDVTGAMDTGILTTAGADRLKVINHVHNGATSGTAQAAIAIVGGDGIEITAERIDGNFSVGGIDIRTTATTDLHVHDVRYFRTRNAADIFIVDTITGSTGQIGPDIFIRLNDDAANITEAVTGATFVVQDPVYVANAANEKGMLINWTASTDA